MCLSYLTLSTRHPPPRCFLRACTSLLLLHSWQRLQAWSMAQPYLRICMKLLQHTSDMHDVSGSQARLSVYPNPYGSCLQRCHFSSKPATATACITSAQTLAPPLSLNIEGYHWTTTSATHKWVTRLLQDLPSVSHPMTFCRRRTPAQHSTYNHGFLYYPLNATPS